ncbi:MAG TPA: PD-(D/E)XK nuclease-like domain-containing protein [Phycisphaerales bacterium]|nr:PD-(D/E)XK nuclease-like domain-containing protein [Phycisphaerales bacterium]
MPATEPLRFSRLKLMGQSPAHYLAQTPVESSAIDVGNAADSLILGDGPGVIGYHPGKKRSGKEWEAFEAEHSGKVILTATEYAKAQGMAEAVAKHSDATRLLTGAIRKPRFWELLGYHCRGTPDVDAPDYLTDLKTGETSSPRKFPWKVRDFSYHAQLAWYQDGTELAGMGRRSECYIVAVEQAPPHVVTVFRINPHALDLGRRLYRVWLEHLKLCEESGRFPGYSDAIYDLDLPDPDEMYSLAAAGVEQVA